MDVSLFADTVTLATQKGLGFLRGQTLISNSNINISVSDPPPSDQPSSLHITSAIFDALAPPPVRRNRFRAARRTILRKKRHTRRRSDDDDDDGGEDYVFCFGDGEDGVFGGAGGGWGGSGGGGGRGWNFDRFGEQNSDESSSWFSSSSSDFAYGFIYEVIYWIALSNCVHFAFKKVVRILTDGLPDGEREKVPMRLAPVC